MRKNKFIQVLWVENDPEITASYPREADMVAGIELKPFPTWEDAEEALAADYDNWDAIVLDAKCVYKRGEADKANRFLMNAFDRIKTLASIKHRIIPWYVLSGQGEDDIRDLIPESNEWDADWEKITNRRFYSKNGIVSIGGVDKQERQVLFERIKTQVNNYAQELQIEYVLYPDLFSVLDRTGMAGDVGYHLMRLLRPIHFGGVSNADYNLRYVDLRKALEYMFRHMAGMGILPACILSKGKKDGVNLSWSSLFLGGTQPEDPENANGDEGKFWKKVIRNTESPLLPKPLADWLKSAILQAGGAVHTTTNEEEFGRNLDKYLVKVTGSPYMLRSLTMGLCDLILWYDNFLRENPDEEMNALNFWMARNSKF